MNAKTKKGLIIAGIALDMAATIYLFIVAIVMLATMPKKGATPTMGGMIGYFQGSDTGVLVYFFTNVLPLLILLALNIFILVRYIKKVGNKKVALNDLTPEQKDALRKQLLEEMNKSSSEPAEEEKKE